MKYLTPTAVPKHCLAEVCQNCQSHKNKPSRCQPIGKPRFFTARKQAACPDFLNKYTGQGLK